MWIALWVSSIPNQTKPSGIESSAAARVHGSRSYGWFTGSYIRAYSVLVRVYLYLSDTTHRTIQAPAPHLLIPTHSPNRSKARHLGSAGEVAVAVAVTSVPSCRKPWSISAGKIGNLLFSEVKAAILLCTIVLLLPSGVANCPRLESANSVSVP